MMLEINKIYFEDCLEGMKKIDDKSIDMILADLPYGKTINKWDEIISFSLLWKQYNRIIKNNGIILLFGVEPFSSYLRISNIKNYKYDLIWIKNQSGSFVLAKKRPMQYHENISVFYKKQPIYNPIFGRFTEATEKNIKYISGDKSQIKNNNINGIQIISHGRSFKGAYPKSYVQIKADRPRDRLHPSQKPVELCEYLIKTYTDERMLVLDNVIGSGTTAIACINTHRNYIGFENNEKYYNIANERIKKHLESLKCQ